MEENQKTPRSFTYMSDTIGEIAGALSEFQGSIEQPKLEKDVKVKMKSGGQYSFKYADLSACVKAAAPCLKANGLAVAQIINEGKLITILTHKSGEWIKSELLLPPQTNDYQAYGSAITYLKRYSYCAILGIVADTDDDANLVHGNEAVFKECQPQVVSQTGYTAEQLQKALQEMCAVKSFTDYNNVWTKWVEAIPALAATNSEFYKYASAKGNELKATKAN